ncbi:MAG: hypothetical protein SF028_06195 [Candidatus Sumerlaeia bacterium]|nr:hypothetical protein [Candidatus Sumerlaeia bacterium]
MPVLRRLANLPPPTVLSAVEEWEYTPYGVPTVRPNERGQPLLRMWDEAAEAVAEGGGLVANPRKGRPSEE